MMKLSIIAPTFYPNQSGYSHAFQGLCNSILNNGVVNEITVYILGEGNEDITYSDSRVFIKNISFKGVGKIFSKLPPKIAINVTAKLFKSKLTKLYAELDNDDLVLLETAEQGWLSYLLDQNLKTPVVTRLHGAFPEAAIFFSKDVPYGKAYFDLLMETKNIASTTYHYIDFIRNYLKDHTKLRNKSFHIIPNTYINDMSELIECKNSSNGALSLLQLGRMDKRGYYYKGFDDVINALYLFEEKNVKSKLKYTVIGTGENAQKFKEKLKKLNQVDVEYFESLPNSKVKDLISECDVVLIPSRNEGMSIFVVECIRQGKPFIFTKGNNGLRDILVDGYNGIAVNPMNSIEIEIAIEKYLSEPSLLEKFSLNSKTHYSNFFSNEMISKHFSVLIKDLVK